MDIDRISVLGRVIAAARMLGGLDQSDLAKLAGVSASTISNVERGSDAKEETVRAVRKALRSSGVMMSIDRRNGMAFAAIRFDEPDDDDF